MKKSYILVGFAMGIVLGAIAMLIMNKNVDSSIVEDARNESTATEVRDLSWVDGVHGDMLDVWKIEDKTFDERLVQEVLLNMAHLKGEVHVE